MPSKTPVKPLVILTGQDGTAFHLLAAVNASLKEAGADPEYIKKFQEEATSGDYDHMVATALTYIT